MTEFEEAERLEGTRQSASRRWFVDWRVWFGIAITGFSLWFALKDVDLRKVAAAVGEADLFILFALSVPCYIVSVYVRALRWRHLTNPIADIPRSALFRAQSLGFMVNNLVPLRIGEFVRSWALAREQGTSATAILGTVVIERVLDVISVLLLAAGALTWVSLGEDSLLSQGTRFLLPTACVPIVGLIILRFFPEQLIAIAHFLARPLPDRVGPALEKLLLAFTEGLGSLKGGMHLLWILFHTLVIWLLLSTIPVFAGIWAFGLELGSPTDVLVICWIVLAAVGVAVAIPSAPGFVGTYQLAFQFVLQQFGVDPAKAFAIGLMVWFVFWISLVGLGLLVLRVQHTSLRELTLQSSKDPDPQNR